MANTYFRFKLFIVHQDQCAMKVCTDSCILGALAAEYFRTAFSPAKKILDIGGGSGLLSLMLAQKIPAQIHAIEIDNASFLQMQQNFEASPWPSQLHAIQSNIKDFDNSHKYDFIISNPPFYENDLKGPEAKRSRAMHDTGLTLFDLIIALRRHLNDDGLFAVMLPYRRAEEFKNYIAEFHGRIHKEIQLRHHTEKEFFRSVFMGDLCSGSFSSEIKTFTIMENNSYSNEMKLLLKDYYLNF